MTLIESSRSATQGTFVASLLALGRHPSARIMRELVAGPRRYNELLAALPEFAEPLIGAYLRDLDGDELVQRRVDPGPPLRVLYALTPLGQELAPSLGTIAGWAGRPDQA
jgi:DNA-binding HxlR family transcriptional regulator